MNSPSEDQIIIDRILSGDHTACNSLVFRYQTYVYTLVWRMLKNKEDTEEVTQDVFIKAIKNLRAFRKESKFSTWLYRIAYNESISCLRRKRLHQPLDEDTPVELVEARAISSLQENERMKYITLALDRLHAEDAAVLTMFYLQEMSLQEIADITGQQTNTLKVRLHRARKRMVQTMETLLSHEVASLL